MKKSLYAVYDKVAEIFFNPITHINDADAIRHFDNVSRDEKNVNKNDYVLYRLADFNDNNGVIVPCTPLAIRTGFDIKTNNEE